MHTCHCWALLIAAAALLSCTRNDPPGAQAPVPSTSSKLLDAGQARVAASQPSAAVSIAAPLTSQSSAAALPADAGVDSASEDAAAAIDWKNKAKPDLTSAELEKSARLLLEAIAKDDPEIAREFFFPREPFKPLKDVADADRYWVQLYAAYKRDIHELHRKRRDWSGAAFESFALGTPPTWVKPGDEYNKIGYYRTFKARLRYTVGERKGSIEVHTIISWNGQWHITHLLPLKH